MNPNKLYLANRLYVPASLVEKSVLDKFTYEFTWTEADEAGDLVDQVEVIRTYRLYPGVEISNLLGHPVSDVGYYGFARGNVSKLLELFSDQDIADERSVSPLGFDLELLEEFEHENKIYRLDQDSRWAEQTATFHQWLKYGYGTLKAPAGWGKTLWLWRIIAHLNQKTMLFAHTTGLRDQFISTGKKHTNLEDLERFHGVTVAGSYDTSYDQIYPVTSSTFQSWYKHKEKLATLRNYFGLVAVDESHHVPALTYARIITELNPMFLLGITATPNRKDGTEVVLFDVVGPVVAEAHGEQLQCDVVFEYTACTIPQNEANRSYMGPWNYMLQKIINNRPRNDFIVEKVCSDIQLGHKVLVLSDRQEHIELLCELINASGYKAAYIHAGVWNRDDIKKSMMDNELDVIVAGKVFNEGENVPVLSSLHMVTPNSNEPLTEQRIGRIRRPHPGKLRPIIRDYIDVGHNMLFAAKETRLAVYRRMGFPIYDSGPRKVDSL